MKSRIGRLEGESRTTKRLHESLGKHVKILEIALKKEREKVRNLSKSRQGDVHKDHKDNKDFAREELQALAKGRQPDAVDIS